MTTAVTTLGVVGRGGGAEDFERFLLEDQGFLQKLFVSLEPLTPPSAPANAAGASGSGSGRTRQDLDEKIDDLQRSDLLKLIGRNGLKMTVQPALNDASHWTKDNLKQRLREQLDAEGEAFLNEVYDKMLQLFNV